jgi:hypothetical protein
VRRKLTRHNVKRLAARAIEAEDSCRTAQQRCDFLDEMPPRVGDVSVSRLTVSGGAV